MDGQEFTRIVKEAFLPFLGNLGFRMDPPLISGRYYRVSFDSQENVVSISYEPGDNALFIMIFSRINGQLSDIDDRSETPRIADLNSRYMPFVTNEERAKNDLLFDSIQVSDDEEKLLLKCAKELSLVLPMYLGKLVTRNP
jgi:hypothetical protein